MKGRIMDNEFILFDRLTKIRSVIDLYGQENFYISYSGGKDSVVLSHLIDEALPDNNIPRVFANTGIEYNKIIEFVSSEKEKDPRIVILRPSVPIKLALKMDGYPFKSKFHSDVLSRYQKSGKIGQLVLCYLQEAPTKSGKFLSGDYVCPMILKYQFTSDFNIKVSDKCCFRLKEEPLKKWQKENCKPYSIIGVMRSEKGRRESAKCLAFCNNKLKAFQPLVPLSKEWENWYISLRGIQLCDLYYPPYNFVRTGCKGCPFNIYIQRELDTLEKFFPLERKQCEIIWKPVYDEYRRIGYRLRPIDNGFYSDGSYQMNITDFL